MSLELSALTGFTKSSGFSIDTPQSAGFVVSTPGRRQHNEDAFQVASAGSVTYVGLFDGHGGAEAAWLARDKLHERLLTRLADGEAAEPALSHAFIDIDTEIAQRALISGTTAVAILIGAETLTVAHVGDTRAVLIRDGKVVCATRDHAITDPEERARYRASRWFREKSRLISQGKIRGFRLTTIARSLGDTFFEDALSPEPEVASWPWWPGDTLIVATDGLWRFVEAEVVCQRVAEHAQVEALCHTVVNDALTRGSTDNISMIAVRYSA